jgi:hypothetical protein
MFGQRGEEKGKSGGGNLPFALEGPPWPARPFALYSPAKEPPPCTARPVLSTVEQKEMKQEKSILPLVGKRNYGVTTAPPSLLLG